MEDYEWTISYSKAVKRSHALATRIMRILLVAGASSLNAVVGGVLRRFVAFFTETSTESSCCLSVLTCCVERVGSPTVRCTSNHSRERAHNPSSLKMTHLSDES